MKYADHVIIKNQVFRWEEKAPFVPSGKSVLGAIEYNREEEKIKCHECGSWHMHLATHIAMRHGSTTEYRSTHGINRGSALIVPSIRKEMRRRAMRDMSAPASKRFGSGASRGNRKAIQTARGPEWQNSKGACIAQTALAIKIRAEELGRVPVSSDFSGAVRTRIYARFGSFSNALKAVGLESTYHFHTKRSLIDSLVDFYTLNKRLPKFGDFYSRMRLASWKTYINHFGTMENAFFEAGLSIEYEKTHPKGEAA